MPQTVLQILLLLIGSPPTLFSKIVHMRNTVVVLGTTVYGSPFAGTRHRMSEWAQHSAFYVAEKRTFSFRAQPWRRMEVGYQLLLQ